MVNYRFTLAVCPLVISTSTTSWAQNAAVRDGAPNVLVIVSDDAGYADFGCYGARDVRTPHIDALARAGVRMTSGYVTASVCSPSRAGLLTGRYQQRFGHEFNPDTYPCNGFSYKQMGLSADEQTIGDAMRALGYRTMAIGKWHMGNQEQFMPLHRGFDECFAVPDGSRSYWPYSKHTGWENHIYDNERAVPEDQITYLTDDLTDAAVRYIQRQGEHPFFLYLSYTAVHTPVQAKQQDIGTFLQINNELRRRYAGMMKALDDGVGRVQSALEDMGLTDRTLIFFINDNGGATNNGSDNGPLRGMKGMKWEGGIRIPFFITWPGHLPAGITYDQPVSALDILPTAVAATGGNWHGNKPLDGINLLPYLTGQNAGSPHEILFWRHGVAAAVRQGPWKLIRVQSDPLLLFNLDKDLGETTNLAEREPQRVAELLDRLKAWEAELAPPHWGEVEQWSQWQIAKHRMDVIGRDAERAEN